MLKRVLGREVSVNYEVIIEQTGTGKIPFDDTEPDVAKAATKPAAVQESIDSDSEASRNQGQSTFLSLSSHGGNS